MDSTPINSPISLYEEHDKDNERINEAYRRSVVDGNSSALLKEELRLSIKAKRHGLGQDDIDTTSTPEASSYQLRPEEIERRKKRKEQNRRAAEKCRVKKKETFRAKEEEHTALVNRNKQLVKMIAALKKQMAKLEILYQRHINLGKCTIVGAPPSLMHVVQSLAHIIHLSADTDIVPISTDSTNCMDTNHDDPPGHNTILPIPDRVNLDCFVNTENTDAVIMDNIPSYSISVNACPLNTNIPDICKDNTSKSDIVTPIGCCERQVGNSLGLQEGQGHVVLVPQSLNCNNPCSQTSTIELTTMFPEGEGQNITIFQEEGWLPDLLQTDEVLQFLLPRHEETLLLSNIEQGFQI